MTTTSKSAAHTPGPLQTRAAKIGGDVALLAANVMADDGRQIIVAECFADLRRSGENSSAEASANAARIVLCVNTHDEMLAALRAANNVATFIEATLASLAVPPNQPEVSRAFADIRGVLKHDAAIVRAALARAEGRE